MTRWLLWVALTVPLAWQGWRYATGIVYYGEFVHWTGLQSARLLLVTLAVSPLLRLWPGAAPLRWLMRRRRDLGLITFVYALAHTLAYLVQKADAVRILREGSDPGLATGWLAFLLFLALAVTSNDLSVRRLGRTWRRLHASVYPAAILTFLHWVLTAFDPTAGWVHAGVLTLLLALRLRWRKPGNRAA